MSTFKATLRVGDVMRREVPLMGGEEPLSKAIGMFKEMAVPIVAVVDESGKPLGVVTERMALRSTLNVDAVKARSVALRAPILSTGDSLARAARLMLENNLKALLVEEDGKLVGTLTIEDIVQALGDRFYSRFKVRDVMTRDPITVSPDSTIGKALVLMRDNGISRLPVVEGDKLRGILTIHDIIVKVIQPKSRATRGEVSGEKIRTLSQRVREIMTPQVVTASPEESLSSAIKRMSQHDVSCLVVTYDKRVVGIITRADILEPVAALEEPERPPIYVQVSFKLKDVSEHEKQEVMGMAERYISKLGERLGTGYLLLHFKEHKEKHGEDRLIHCRARLNTDKIQLVGVGEAWTPAQAARVALDKIERQFLVMKEVAERYPYADEIFSRLIGEL